MNDPKLLDFTHLLVEQKGKYFYENEDMRRTHEILDTVNCFSNIGVEYRSVFPIKIKTRPCVIILRRKLDIVPPSVAIPSPLSIEPPLVKPTPNIIETKSAIPTSSTANLKIDESIDPNNDGEINEKNDEDAEIPNENIGETENTDDTDDDDYYDENAKKITKNADDIESDDNPSQDDTFDSADNDDDQNIVETELKRPSRETKIKLKKLIEKHYRTRAARLPPNDQTDLAAASLNRPSIRSNIRQIIKKEKIKEVIERISQIDLRTVCDLERESTKQCLLKVIDSFID